MTFLWMLSELRTPILDTIMQLVTYCGQEIIIIAVICTFYWCADKRFAYIVGFTYFTAGLFVQTLKITFRIPRPWIIDPSFQAVESALPGATGYSFPSGHTQSAVCLFFPLALKSRKIWGRIFCCFIFLLIGFSRMYLGCHTPKDVLTAMGLSVLISCVIWHFQNSLLRGGSHTGRTSIILAAISIAAAGYALTLNINGIIETRYAVDCCKAAGAGLGFAAGWYIEQTYLNFNAGCTSVRERIFILLPGLIFTLFLKIGISFLISVLFGSSVLAKALEYFILVLWVLVIYPFLFTKVQRRTI